MAAEQIASLAYLQAHHLLPTRALQPTMPPFFSTETCCLNSKSFATQNLLLHRVFFLRTIRPRQATLASATQLLDYFQDHKSKAKDYNAL